MHWHNWSVGWVWQQVQPPVFLRDLWYHRIWGQSFIPALRLDDNSGLWVTPHWQSCLGWSHSLGEWTCSPVSIKCLLCSASPHPWPVSLSQLPASHRLEARCWLGFPDGHCYRPQIGRGLQWRLISCNFVSSLHRIPGAQPMLPLDSKKRHISHKHLFLSVKSLVW